MLEIPAALLSWFYSWTNSYTIAIALMSVVVMAITTPLTLKSTKGMLEMQKIAPEMRKLQAEYRDDRQKLNEEMMKLYQDHKVNPLSSCLPILAQMPIFILMFRILRGLTYTPRGAADEVADATLRAIGADTDPGFIPRYLSADSAIATDLYDETEITSIGLDLALSPAQAIAEGPLLGLIYTLLVVGLGALYWFQQRMVAARAAISPTMSPTQQKLMQYLPVVFAVFQVFFLAALVIYYVFQTLLRILQQYYITRRFYGSDESLGRQAQRASEAAREDAKKRGEDGGLFGQMKRDLGGARGNDNGNGNGKGTAPKKKATNSRPTTSKRVTPPKGRPASTGGKGRPTPTRKEAQARRTSRPKSGNKKKKR